MPEIGVTLREARMRAGIDIAEVESRTKIRAKYLRALENEEWSLLPGTTFVKSFLRTYAEALGLDAKLLVEEYKFRHEPYENGGANGISRPNGRRGRRGSASGAFEPPRRGGWLLLVLLILLIAAVIFAVVRLSRDEGTPPPVAPVETTTTTANAEKAESEAAERRQRLRQIARRTVSLRVTATAPTTTFVCVRDARGRTVIDGKSLEKGEHTKTVRSQRFDITIGAPRARVTNGRQRLQVEADAQNVIAYRVTKDELTRLPAGRRPACS